MDDRDIVLVSLVQQHRHIYDKNSNYFKDKTAVETSWRIIASAMKTTEDDCQRRWCVLRNRYAKERREQCKGEPSKKGWPLMETMSFLEAHVKRRRSYRAMQEYMMDQPSVQDRFILPAPEKLEEIIIDEDEDLDEEEPELKHVHSDQSNTSSFFADEDITIYKQPLPKPPEMQPAPRIVSSTTIENSDSEVEILKTEKKPVEVPVPTSGKPLSPAIDDSNMHFCLSLHETMRKIPNKFLTKAKIEILQVLDKYENAN